MRRYAPLLMVLGMICFSVPALADGWGNTSCHQAPSAACDIGVGTGGKPSGSGSGGDPGHGSGSGAPVGTSCQWMSVGGSGDGQQGRPGPPGQQGTWYVRSCLADGTWQTDLSSLTWVPFGAQPPANTGAAPPSPAELAEFARKQLRLPAVSIAANPTGDQLVNLPTWLWLPSGWGPVSATATVPGVSVTATATPTSVVWSMGDGSTVTCAGAGTPFRPGTDPKASSPDCGHTYRTSSASQAGQAFPVSATVHWTVTWAGAGQGGVFPDLTTTGNAAFRVAESQALNNGG